RGKNLIGFDLVDEDEVANGRVDAGEYGREVRRREYLRMLTKQPAVPRSEELGKPLQAEEMKRPLVLLANVADRFVMPGSCEVRVAEEDEAVAGVLVSLDFRGVLVEFLLPVLPHTVGENRRLAGDHAVVDGVATAVLETAKRFECRIALKRHDVATEPLEL